jgi:Fic family protein
MHALGRLDDATLRFPNPNLLVRPALRREAVGTSALEGTFTHLGDILAADSEEPASYPADIQEVVNAIRAAEAGAEAISSGRPLSVHLACQLQEILIAGTRTEGADTGRVRRTNAFIGRPDQRVHETRFVPMPAGPSLDAAFRDWETWVNGDDDTHLLVKVALAHYQFEAIHPFHDGNGRVGRLLAILHLMCGEALHHPNLALSVWLQSHDTEYRDGLAAVSATGSFDPWVGFLARGIKEQAEHERQRVDRLLALREDLVAQVRESGTRGLAVRITEDLIGYPFMRVTEAARRYQKSFQATNRAVARLVDLGVLRQRGTGSYARVFVADEVVRAITE